MGLASVTAAMCSTVVAPFLKRHFSFGPKIPFPTGSRQPIGWRSFQYSRTDAGLDLSDIGEKG